MTQRTVTTKQEFRYDIPSLGLGTRQPVSETVETVEYFYDDDLPPCTTTEVGTVDWDSCKDSCETEPADVKYCPTIVYVTTHYAKSDPDCLGDYSKIVVKFEYSGITYEFGDSYHDKGQEKVEGFLLGIGHYVADLEVIYAKVADSDY